MIGVIADDLTGAAEIGAIGKQRGLTAEIYMRRLTEAQAEVVCVDTDSRHCPPEEAARRAAAAARSLVSVGAEWIYKKTDSVLRGNVTAEIEAIGRELGLPAALLIPANPSLGRTIEKGRYFIGGQPLDRTDFASDPTFPRQTSRVLELVRPPERMQLLYAAPEDPLPATGLVLGAAANMEEVARWGSRKRADWLMAGGGDFFSALLQAKSSQRTELRVAGLGAGELFVCGSASVATREFVDRQRNRGVTVFTLPVEVAITGRLRGDAAEKLVERVRAALRGGGRVVLAVGSGPVAGGGVADCLANELVRVAAGAIEKAPVARVYSEGGATSAALAHAMGWERLEILGELSRGVVMLRPGPDRVWIIKPGSYRWPGEIG